MTVARPIVAVGAVVVDHDRLLLVRRGRGPGRGRWSVPGGKVEVGETLAEAVTASSARRRGSRACAVRCSGGPSGSTRPTTIVILDFEVTLVGDDQPVAGDDAAEAAWVELHDVAELDLADGVAELLPDNGIIATFT